MASLADLHGQIAFHIYQALIDIGFVHQGLIG